MDRLVKEIRTQNHPEDALATLIPPIEDPIILEPFEIPLNISLDIGGSHPVDILGSIEFT